MSDGTFDARILGEKLLKLNNSQQSIESLSRWCVSHRRSAEQIVGTWSKQFSSSQKEKRVSLLYLANDILQNSRKRCSDFVTEFWKVLPSALKQVFESGDENGKKAVTRLVGIWEERKVFGSRGQNLKDGILGENPPFTASNSPLEESNAKCSNPIKLEKRDAHSVRFKLAIGDPAEKIMTAFQNVLDDQSKEETALNKCDSALHQLNKIEEDVQLASSQGNQHVLSLVDHLLQQEKALQQCMGQLESAETTWVALVYQLKEALREQESKLEFIRGKLRVAQAQMERATNLRKRLSPDGFSLPQSVPLISKTEPTKVADQNDSSSQLTIASLSQPVVSFASLRTTEEENKKAAAAAVAAKLTASTSSAQMLSSILSSLVAEETAASMGSNSQLPSFTSGLPVFPPEKRPKVENPIADASNFETGNSGYFTPLLGNYIRSPFVPPLPFSTSSNPSIKEYVQSTGTMVGMMPYSYGTNATLLPPPPPPSVPPLPPGGTKGLPMPLSQPLQLPQSQPPHSQLQLQQASTGGFYRPPGIGFNDQNHHHNTSTPAVP